jgi:putative protease
MPYNTGLPRQITLEPLPAIRYDSIITGLAQTREVNTMKEVKIATVADYFANIGVVALNLTGEIEVGDTIHFKGHTTDFSQEIESMQIENEQVEKAGKGDSVGIKVKDRVREHDDVFKVVED